MFADLSHTAALPAARAEFRAVCVGNGKRREVKVSPLFTPPSPSLSLHRRHKSSSCNLSSTQPFISTTGGVKSSSTHTFSLSHFASGRRKSHYSCTCGKNRPFILIGAVNTDQRGYWSCLRTSEVDSSEKLLSLSSGFERGWGHLSPFVILLKITFLFSCTASLKLPEGGGTQACPLLPSSGGLWVMTASMLPRERTNVRAHIFCTCCFGTPASAAAPPPPHPRLRTVEIVGRGGVKTQDVSTTVQTVPRIRT